MKIFLCSNYSLIYVLYNNIKSFIVYRHILSEVSKTELQKMLMNGKLAYGALVSN